MLKKLLLGICTSICCIFLSSQIYAQQKTVTGTITNATNNTGIGNATVSVKGTNVAVSSSANGDFTISVPDGKTTLSISSVGFDVEEVSIAGKSSVTVSLKEKTSNLNEVVVTGYTSQRKKDLTASVAVVNVKDYKSIPSGTGEALLQGQAAGVTVVNSGTPGGGSNVRIRGITSIGSTNPLVLIDGTPGSLTDINVNDIASLQILKDAGGAAIYGVRGSNGVIVVTTKKGLSSKPRVSYDGFYGTQFAYNDGFDIANTQETANAVQQSYINSGLTPGNKQFGTGTTPVIPNFITPTAGATAGPDPYALYTNQTTPANQQGTVWFNEIFKDAPYQSHTLSVAQASEKSNFYLSAGYLDQQGTLIETYLKRYSVRINTSFNISDHIRIGENGYFFYKQNPGFTNQNEGNAISMSYRESPIIPVYDAAGNYAGTGSQGLGNAQNPVANLQRTQNNTSNNYQANGNVYGEVDFLKDFTVRTQFGGTIDNYNYRFFNYTQYENAENNRNPNSFSENMGYNSNWTWTNTLKYNKTFGDNTISVLAGTEAIEYAGRAINGTRGDYYITDPSNLTVDPNLWTLNFGSPNGQVNSNINGTPYASSIFSLFGKVDYAYKDKYLISGTIRRDGSSVFAPGKQYGTFPSVSAGWRLSQESFMQTTSSWLNDFKIRGSWGKLGSISNIPTTNAFSIYSQSAANSFYDLNGANNSSLQGFYASQAGNVNTTWEQDIITDFGFDATLFKKFDLTFDWYNKAINGLLFAPLSDITVVGGATPAAINAGDISNKGIDISLTYHGLAVKNELRYDITANFSKYNNLVEALPPGIQYYDRGSAGSGRLGAFSRLQPGQALGAFFGYKQLGLFADAADVAKSPIQDGAEPGFMKYEDNNGTDANGQLTGVPDGRITTADRTFFGNPNPDFVMGMNIAASYKSFDFSTFLYASVGNDVINYVRFWTDFPQVWDGAISRESAVNSWTPTNQGAKVPKLSRASTFSNTNTFSSYYMEDGSFLRMKSLIIGYTMPVEVTKKIGIDKVRFYLQGLNLFTMTQYTGIDPELTGSNLNDNTNFGIDFGNYPANQKAFNVGLNVTF